MTLDELKEAIEELLPGCDIDVDETGEVIIYTNKCVDDDAELVDIEDWDDFDEEDLEDEDEDF